MDLLPAVEIETGPKPVGSVVWLHGLGADGNDFLPILDELQLPENISLRFIFPHAPQIPITINGGFTMPAWYDILEMSLQRKIDTEGLLRSVQAIRLFIDRENARGIASENIALIGFSQGGAVAYHLALADERSFAGLLALSTYFATAAHIPCRREDQSSLPIEIHHGEFDSIVPIELAFEAIRLLSERGYQPTFREYPMEHAICPEQIADISGWLQSTFSLNDLGREK
ncbi:MAG: carboxylesterase [Desulfobacterales bacterium]|nr:MAG: carboxylesterase [Desulfobacterales bacterium]